MSELNETLPAISVIIPVYNAEKYIQQCLSSILIQTFQDYEVIVVDDCSTDDSIKIIELMMPIFKDKLKLIKRSKNSGSPAIPRNIGMRCSRGKYISFIDNDDVFTKNTFFGNWVVWNKLFRRGFIIENYLEFPNLKVADDMMFNFFCLCLAKKHVHVPNITYIYRNMNDSISVFSIGSIFA